MNRFTFLIVIVVLAALSNSLVALSLRAPLVYPGYAIENCIEGFVKAKYTYSQEGRPTEINIIEASSPGVFEEAALNYMRGWHNPKRAGQTEQNTIEFILEGYDDCNS